MKFLETKEATMLLLAAITLLQASCTKVDKESSELQSQITNDKVLTISSELDSLSVHDSASLMSNGKRPSVSPSNKYEKHLSKVTRAGLIQSGGMGMMSPYTVGSSFNGSYYGTGRYVYPDYSIDLSATQHGTVINVNLTSYDVPNKFDILDASGQLIVTTGWMGYATYHGPWGSSLNTAQSKVLRFLKSSSNYKMRVETVTQSYSDSWEGNVTSGGSFDSKFQNIGFFHNNHLANVNNNFNGTSGTYSGALNEIRDFNRNYWLTNQSAFFNPVFTTADVYTYSDVRKNIADYEYFGTAVNNPSDTNSMSVAMSRFNAIPLINSANKQLLQRIANLVGSNANGNLSNSQVEPRIISIINDWLNINYGVEQQVGSQITGIILSIGYKSCEWWRLNPTAFYDPNGPLSLSRDYHKKDNEKLHSTELFRSNVYNLKNANSNYSTSLLGVSSILNKYSMLDSLIGYQEYYMYVDGLTETYYALPVWVAADVAGGFISAGLSAAGQYAVTGDVNMRGVYMSAGLGAISSSTGLVGRFARFLRSKM